jgi:hypothetical protein
LLPSFDCISVDIWTSFISTSSQCAFIRDKDTLRFKLVQIIDKISFSPPDFEKHQWQIQSVNKCREPTTFLVWSPEFRKKSPYYNIVNYSSSHKKCKMNKFVHISTYVLHVLYWSFVKCFRLNCPLQTFVTCTRMVLNW